MRIQKPLATLAIAALLAPAGCGNSSRSREGQVLGGATPSGIASSDFQGLPPTGPAFDGPPLHISTPARGSYSVEPQVLVQGYVDDPEGLGIGGLHVNGMDATIFDPATGEFQTTVPLEPGINTVVVDVWDNQGRRTTRHVSVMHGALTPETQTITNSSTFRLTELGLEVLRPMVAQGVADQKASIRQQVLSNPVQDVKLTGFDFGGTDAYLWAEPGGIRFEVLIQNVRLDIEASTEILIVFNKTFKGAITTSELVLRGTVAFEVQNGQLVGNVVTVDASALGFTVPDFARNEFRRIQDSFESSFADATRDGIQQALQEQFGSGTSQGSISRSVVDAELRLDWALRTLTFDDEGITGVFDSNVVAIEPTYGELSGSLVTDTPVAQLMGGGMGPNFGVALHQNAFNRTLHAAWRAGVLKQRYDQERLSQMFPDVPNDLSTTALIASIPEVADFLPPGLPLVIGVESLLPPMILATPRDPQLFDLYLGGLRVQVDLIHPTEGALVLSEAVYSARLPVALVENAGTITLVPVGNPEVHVDVEGTSLPGAEKMLEQLTQPGALKATMAQIEGVEIPATQGLTLTGLTFSNVDESVVLLGQLARAR